MSTGQAVITVTANSLQIGFDFCKTDRILSPPVSTILKWIPAVFEGSIYNPLLVLSPLQNLICDFFMEVSDIANVSESAQMPF